FDGHPGAVHRRGGEPQGQPGPAPRRGAWVLIHMIEETARHAGHVDILRELIDGMAGDHRPG
ncbi:MAG: DinB family protein, partial [Actinomycetota bacterium]|nr:DinB family protein [Actinomycetota bacterium]